MGSGGATQSMVQGPAAFASLSSLSEMRDLGAGHWLEIPSRGYAHCTLHAVASECPCPAPRHLLTSPPCERSQSCWLVGSLSIPLPFLSTYVSQEAWC